MEPKPTFTFCIFQCESWDTADTLAFCTFSTLWCNTPAIWKRDGFHHIIIIHCRIKECKMDATIIITSYVWIHIFQNINIRTNVTKPSVTLIISSKMLVWIYFQSNTLTSVILQQRESSFAFSAFEFIIQCIAFFTMGHSRTIWIFLCKILNCIPFIKAFSSHQFPIKIDK